MKGDKELKYLVLLLASFIVLADSDQIAFMKEQQKKMNPSYPGSLTFSEVLNDVFNKNHPESKIEKVEVTLQVVSDSEIISKDKEIGNAPIDLTKEKGIRKDVSISVPFDFDSYASKKDIYTGEDRKSTR